MFDEILNYKEFYFIGGNWGIIKYYKEFFEDWNKKREEKGVYWYDLVDQEVLVKQRDVPELKHYEIKILPQEVTSPAVILVYGNKVVNILWKKKAILIVIENKEITSHYLKYFDMLWKNSKSN